MSDETQPGIRETVYKQPAGKEPTPATEVTGMDVRQVEAQTVIMQQSRAETITAERLNMEKSAARAIDGKSVQMENSAAMVVSSERTVLQGASAAVVSSTDLRMVGSQALVVNADQAQLEGSRALVLAGQPSGDVRVLFNVSSAAMFGAAVGVGLALASSILRRLFGRKGR